MDQHDLLDLWYLYTIRTPPRLGKWSMMQAELFTVLSCTVHMVACKHADMLHAQAIQSTQDESHPQIYTWGLTCTTQTCTVSSTRQERNTTLKSHSLLRSRGVLKLLAPNICCFLLPSSFLMKRVSQPGVLLKVEKVTNPSTWLSKWIRGNEMATTSFFTEIDDTSYMADSHSVPLVGISSAVSTEAAERHGCYTVYWTWINMGILHLQPVARLWSSRKKNVCFYTADATGKQEMKTFTFYIAWI